jgi:transcriptional repressor NrdR
MKCPHCDQMATRVIDSRTAEHGVRRRRECQGCGERFTTYEQYQAVVVMVLKNDRRREEFQREKLLRSLRIATRKRPLPANCVEDIVDDIERRLMASGRAEVPSRVIGEMAMSQLKVLDVISYIRFASAYREFVSLDDMLHELDQLTFSPMPPPEQRRLFDDDLARLLSGADDLPETPIPIETAPSLIAIR